MSSQTIFILGIFAGISFHFLLRALVAELSQLKRRPQSRTEQRYTPEVRRWEDAGK